jgi:hypothetical protein
MRQLAEKLNFKTQKDFKPLTTAGAKKLLKDQLLPCQHTITG